MENKQVWSVQLSQQAELDFSEILKWTVQNFGVQQAKEYAETLRLAIGALSAGPDTVGVSKRDELGSGIYALHVARNGRKGRHFVVFRADEKQTTSVLRLLHDSMDLARHLPS